MAQSARVVEYTDRISAEERKLSAIPNECPAYDTKVPVMPKLWGMRSSPLLPLLLGPEW